MSVTALLALPAVAGADDEPVATAGADALASIQEVDTVVVLAAGTEPLVHDAHIAVRRPRFTELSVRVDTALLTAIADRGQAPRVQTDRLQGDLGHLVAEVVASTGCPVVPVSVAAGADPAALLAVATGLRSAVRSTGRRIAVVAQADLATDGLDTAAFDDDLVEALGVDDAAVFALGPQRAASSGAAGWAPLGVLSHLASSSGRRLQVTARGEVDGRGLLVARAT